MPPLYFVYVLTAGAWVPLASWWMNTEQLQTAMSANAGAGQFGGYVWDGHTMNWQILSTYR